MRLVYKGTNREVKDGDEVLISGTDKGVVNSFEKPHKPSSEGKIYVKREDATRPTGLYVSVIGAEWIEREDHPKESD